MKKFITFDEAAICFFSAIGFGLGLLIPQFFGLPTIVNLICCFALGLLCEEIADHIVFSRFIQANRVRRVLTWLVLIALFFVSSFFALKYLGESLDEDLIEEFAWLFGVPLVSCVVSIISFFIRKRIILKRYGNGRFSYAFSRQAKKYVQGLNGANKEIIGDYNKDISETTQTGTYVPNKNKDVLEFLGIPYAKAPIGELRYKKTVPLETSNKVYEAKYFGPSAPQEDLEGNILKYHNQSEDCLSLNIWTSDDKRRNKPVVVYFPGGFFVAGGSANIVGDGENFIRENPDCVFVSINYRLGKFGFKNDSNLGLYDQIEALKWIKQNISSFGGDSNNVTLLGDTSGATCIMLLCTVKEARGLFKRIIAMSPLLKYNKNQFEYAARPGGNLVPKDVFDSFEKYVDPNVEFIFGLPTEELGHESGILGKEISKEMLENYWDLFVQSLDEEQLDYLKKFKEKKSKIFENEHKALDFIGFLMDHYFVLNIANRLSSKNTLYCFEWDVSSGVRTFEANSNSFLATLLKNKESGDETGFIVDKTLHEVLNNFVKKYLRGDSLTLFNNEVRGVSAIDWPKYNSKTKKVLSFEYKSINVVENYLNDECKFIDSL